MILKEKWQILMSNSYRNGKRVMSWADRLENCANRLSGCKRIADCQSYHIWVAECDGSLIKS